MKKILSILATFGLTATTASVVVSCQTEIKGQTLIDLAEKMNADNMVLTVANAPTDSKESLKTEIVVLLTQTLITDYGMNEEGFFRDSKMQTLTVGEIKVLVDGQIQKDEVKPSDLEGIKDVVFIIEDVQFKFQINFTFKGSAN